MTPVSEPPSTRPTLLAKVACLGNEVAWQRFVDAYGPFIAHRCRLAGLNETDVEDVKQIVLISLMRTLPKFRHDPMKRFRGYLSTVVLNATRTHWRKTWRDRDSQILDTRELENVPDPAFAESLAAVVDDRISSDLELLNQVIERVQGRVETHTWTAYWESAILGTKPSEVAQALGVSAATVYMAKQRVGEMIRKEFQWIQAQTPVE